MGCYWKNKLGSQGRIQNFLKWGGGVVLQKEIEIWAKVEGVHAPPGEAALLFNTGVCEFKIEGNGFFLRLK